MPKHTSGRVTAPKQRVRNDPKVMFAWLSTGQVRSRFMASTLGVFCHEVSRGSDTFSHPWAFNELIASPRIAEARSQVVDAFLKTDCDWLFSVDDDMTFQPNTLERMLLHADPETVPVLGGLCYAGGREGGDMFPTIYEKIMVDGHPAPARVNDFPSERVPRNRLVRVFATGAACMLIHRSVFEKMATAYARLANGKPNPYPWYVEGTVDPNGFPLGEDIGFCMRLEPLDIPIHVHTGIEFGHIKTRELNTKGYLQQRKEHA